MDVLIGCTFVIVYIIWTTTVAIRRRRVVFGDVRGCGLE